MPIVPPSTLLPCFEDRFLSRKGNIISVNNLPAEASMDHQEEPRRIAARHEEGVVEEKSTHGWLLGLVFIVMVSALWGVANIILQYIMVDLGFNQPFAIGYLTSCFMTLVVPSHLGLSLLGFAHNPPFRKEAEKFGDELVFSNLEASGEGRRIALQEQGGEEGVGNQMPKGPQLVAENDDHSSSAREWESDDQGVSTASSNVDVCSAPENSKSPLKSHLFVIKMSLGLAWIMFFSQWTHAMALGYTSNSSSTTISNSGSLFAYAFNVIAGTERSTVMKAVGVALALLGAMLVGVGDREDGAASTESLWGDAAALASAIGYGYYSAVLRVLSPSDDEIIMGLVLGYIGIVNVISLSPLLVMLVLVPEVSILRDVTLQIVLLIVVKSFLNNLLEEYLWARAILLTTPTVATVGLSLSIPIAFVSDYFIYGKSPTVLGVWGALVIVGAFYFVSDGKGRGDRCSNDGDCMTDTE